jgi:hypothetical protein
MRSEFGGERDERAPARPATANNRYEDAVDSGRADPIDPYPVSETEPATAPITAMDSFRPWDYRTDVGWSPEYAMVGYHVEALDSSIGKVKETSYAQHGSYLMVDTGPWIFGRTVVIPAGIVTNIDHVGRRIFLDRTKEQIKSSPDYSDDPVYMEKLAAHYGRA